MEQFSLEKWLQNKSRKVVTKTGEEVKIIDTNAPDENNPIVGYIYHKQKWNGPWSWHIDGVYKVGGDDMDLFFADEKEKLTEFEKAMIQFSHERNSLIQFEHTTEEINAHLYLYSEKLLNLARKELLKDLPKWKKATEHIDMGRHVAIIEDDRVILSDYVEEGEYYIVLDDFKILPKEE